MYEKIFYTLLIITFIIPFSQKPTKIEALSCLEQRPSIGSVMFEGSQNNNLFLLNLNNIAVLDHDVVGNSLVEQIDLHSNYLNNIYSTYTNDLDGSNDFDQYAEISFNLFLENQINIGDVIIRSGSQSVADCGGNSLITVFDKNTKKPKFVVYSGVPVESYNVNGTIVELISLDTPDDATEVATFRINNEIINLQMDNEIIFEVIKGNSYNLDDNIINNIYLIHSTSQESIWGGQPNASFVLTLNQDFIESEDLCQINYSRLIRYGRVGEDVRQTQQCLENLSYDMGPIDGIYGPKTYAGIVAFQTSENIKIDGIVGPQTVSYLNRI